jgi:hypothetical protein
VPRLNGAATARSAVPANLSFRIEIKPFEGVVQFAPAIIFQAARARVMAAKPAGLRSGRAVPGKTSLRPITY